MTTDMDEKTQSRNDNKTVAAPYPDDLPFKDDSLNEALAADAPQQDDQDDENLRRLAGACAPAPGLHSEFDFPAAMAQLNQPIFADEPVKSKDDDQNTPKPAKRIGCLKTRVETAEQNTCGNDPKQDKPQDIVTDDVQLVDAQLEVPERKPIANASTEKNARIIKAGPPASSDALKDNHEDDQETHEDPGEDDNLKTETASSTHLKLDAPLLSSERAFSRVIRERGRELSHSIINIGGTPQRSGRFWLAVLVMLVVISMLVILAHFKHREIQLGYALSNAITQREALLEDNRKLRIELRVLSSRERLATLAEKQLGLIQPRPEQILFLTREPRTKNNPQTTANKRLDGLDNVKILEN